MARLLYYEFYRSNNIKIIARCIYFYSCLLYTSFEEIFNTLKNGYSNENLRYAFAMFHFYLGTLRYIQQFRNATANNDAAEDENVSELAIHYMFKKN